MWIEVDLDEEDHKKVIEFKKSKKIQMSRAYAELIRVGLETEKGNLNTSALKNDMLNKILEIGEYLKIEFRLPNTVRDRVVDYARSKNIRFEKACCDLIEEGLGQ